MKYFEDYLKELPTGQKVVVRVDRINGPKTSKTGKTYYSVKWLLTSNNELIDGALWENTIRFNLDNIPPKDGEVLTAFINGKGYATYRRNDDDVNNTQSVKAESAVRGSRKEDSEKEDQRSRSIVYQAFAKSFIESGEKDIEKIDSLVQTMIKRHDSFVRGDIVPPLPVAPDGPAKPDTSDLPF